MANTSLNIVVTNRRLLNATEAADMCGMPARVFKRLCPVSPVDAGDGKIRFDVRDLDAWIDSLKGGLVEETDDEIVERL